MKARSTWAVLAASALVFGLGLQTAIAHMDTRLEDKRAFRRLWTDVSQAVNAYLDASEPNASIAGSPDPTNDYGDVLVERARLQEIKTYEFWKTLRNKPFLPYRARTNPVVFDDLGRARLLGWGFRLLGGISPFLILWLGLLVAVPVLFWLWIELVRAGWFGGGVVLSVLLVASPFVVECLSMTRYAVGFYLVAAFLAIAVIVPTIAPLPPTLRASVLRAALAGLLLALCIWCRSSVSFMAPGFVMAFVLAARRLPGSTSGRLRGFALLAAIFIAPLLLTRPNTHHDIWPPLWEGLGDFDRKYDHTWSDKNATDLARAAGLDESLDFRTPQAEAIFRKAVLNHVTSDPGWYATILVKRFVSTVTLWKLWPFTPIDGEFIRRKSSPNEGFIDKYFTYTTTVDHFGIATAAPEVPAQLFMAPTILLLAATMFKRWRASVLPFVKGLACFAAVLLPLPVLVTTAGGQETQAFALVHMLAAGFLMQAAVNWYRSRSNRT